MTTADSPKDPNLAKLMAGELVEFAPWPVGREETADERAARTIPAQWIEGLVSKPERVVKHDIKVKNAVISDYLDLRYVTFEAELSFTECEFRAGNNRFPHYAVDFSFATFKRLATFAGSRFFQPITFRAAHAEADLMVGDASFLACGRDKDAASFWDIQVEGAFWALGAQFVGDVSFAGMVVNKGADFSRGPQGNHARFGGDVRLSSAHIAGDLDLTGAEFRHAIFDQIQIEGDALFSGTLFQDVVSFFGAHIIGNADFCGARFGADVSFYAVQVDRDVLFHSDERGQQVEFKSEALFSRARIHGDANFAGAIFESAASFEGVQVDGAVSFGRDDWRNNVIFNGWAKFSSANFGSEVDFTEAGFRFRTHFDSAQFGGEATFDDSQFAKKWKASFNGVRFARGASFRAAQFNGETDFASAFAAREMRFSGAVFGAPATFREARFQTVVFSDLPPADDESHAHVQETKNGTLANATTFKDRIDLRGFGYDRIQGDWHAVLLKAQPFDEPFVALERVFRQLGQEREADRVYLARRQAERRRSFKNRQYGAWIRSWLYLLIARYGVRPYQLVVLPILLLGLGVFIFSQPNAVRAKPENGAGKEVPALSDNFSRGGLAARLSIRVFLPGEVPLATKWEPSDEPLKGGLTFSDFATVLKISGYILVPLGIGALTGLLRTKPRLSD